MLTQSQIHQFHERGYVVVENAVSDEQRLAMCGQLDQWIEQSRHYTGNYGALPDGRARFDVEPGHCADDPRLRRISNPIDVSEIYADTVFNSAIPDMVSDLIGPNIKFDHCKLNNKLPGMATRVDYHQDHVFEPQTNDDVVVALLLLDDMFEANGCLRVVPGSQHEQYTHYDGDVFTGRIDDRHSAYFDAAGDLVVGKAGSICLMHTWAVHGSFENYSDRPRRLFITEYKAADAFPLTRHKLPSWYMDRIVRGRPASQPRYRSGEIELPPDYENASFFSLQTGEQRNAERGADAAA
jgi:ectoine hydroxylase-related dioxygenase (phytanoyl-CoA dioxygenase family)